MAFVTPRNLSSLTGRAGVLLPIHGAAKVAEVVGVTSLKRPLLNQQNPSL